MSYLSDRLETNYGTDILEELTGQTLTRKGQSVRLFDQTSKSAKAYYPADERGKPYVQNFQEGKRWYPLTAWMQAHDLDWMTAVEQLADRYLSGQTGAGKWRSQYAARTSVTAPVRLPPSFHDPALVESTQVDYDRNNLAIYLRRLLGQPVADELLMRFRVGTAHRSVAKEWERCTVFWQIDEGGKVHAGKVMYYSLAIGKRIKDEASDFSKPAWVHDLLSLPDFVLDQCLFGLHQLETATASKPIAIVESEKTAIIATAFSPGFIWLACGGLSQLNAQKCKPLAGRQIVLFPDLGGLLTWNQKAEELKRLGYTVRVSTILENRASSLDRKAGLDLADYLTRHRCPVSGRALNEDEGYPALWDCEPLQAIPSIKPISLTEYFNKE